MNDMHSLLDNGRTSRVGRNSIENRDIRRQSDLCEKHVDSDIDVYIKLLLMTTTDFYCLGGLEHTIIISPDKQTVVIVAVFLISFRTS